MRPRRYRALTEAVRAVATAVHADQALDHSPGCYVASSLTILTMFSVASATSARCWIFQRPTSLDRLSPPNCLNHPNSSSLSLRFCWLASNPASS